MISKRLNIAGITFLAASLMLMFSQGIFHHHDDGAEGRHSECPVCVVSNTAPVSADLANHNLSFEPTSNDNILNEERSNSFANDYNSESSPDRAPPKSF